jgi:shikimate dehydrogenase
MRHLDAIEPMAEHVGSVNTITNENGRLIGATTDGPGALRALAYAGVDLEQRNILFLGSGGAVRAVAFAVAECTKAARVTILGRDPGRAAELVRDLRNARHGNVETGSIAGDLVPAMKTHDVIIQGTPVGMYPHGDETLIPAALLQPRHVVFDMVYQPHETRLIRDARSAGSSVIHGIEMLIDQAALQFERWTGQPPPAGSMRSAVSELWEH